MKVKNPISQNIRIFPRINKKKRICRTEKLSSLKYVHLCTQYLVRAALAQMTASVRCGNDQPVALLRHY